MFMRLAQVVFTLTQFPTVEGVNFKLDGEPIDVLGGEGIIIDHPMSRADYEDMSPAILVESPTVGDTVRQPPAHHRHGQRLRGGVPGQHRQLGRSHHRRQDRHGHFRHRHPRHLRRDHPLRRSTRPAWAPSSSSPTRPRTAPRSTWSRSRSSSRSRRHQTRPLSGTSRPRALRPAPAGQGRLAYLRRRPPGGPRRARPLVALKDQRGLQAVGHPQLAEDVVGVRLDRLLRDEQPGPDHLVGHAQGDQP